MPDSRPQTVISQLLDITSERVVARASAAAFGRPLVTNILRAMLVEAMIAEALAPNWEWCSADYASWDFQNSAGVRLEVKQSAAWQSWSIAGSKPSKCSFDIAARTGRWVGVDWVVEAGRNAELYVLAHHPVVGAEADHRDPHQWQFYVIAADKLPASKTISLSGVRALSLPCSLIELPARVDEVAAAPRLVSVALAAD